MVVHVLGLYGGGEVRGSVAWVALHGSLMRILTPEVHMLAVIERLWSRGGGRMSRSGRRIVFCRIQRGSQWGVFI